MSASSTSAESAATAAAQDAVEAARRGDVPALERALDFGLSPDARTASGDSLVMLAAYHGHAEATRCSSRAVPTRSSATIGSKRRWRAPPSGAIWPRSNGCWRAGHRWTAPGRVGGRR